MFVRIYLYVCIALHVARVNHLKRTSQKGKVIVKTLLLHSHKLTKTNEKKNIKEKITLTFKVLISVEYVPYLREHICI